MGNPMARRKTEVIVAHALTVAFEGISALPVEIQTQIASGFPGINIVGLAEKTVHESKERVRGALSALGFVLPARRITINLSPADLVKEGGHYDLPIALSMLAALKMFPLDNLEGTLALGELALDARLVPVAGVLPAARYAYDHRLAIICPKACGNEAALMGEKLHILAATDLLSLIGAMRGQITLARPNPNNNNAKPTYAKTLENIKGQRAAKRVLEIAAAGAHNLMMIGPPGAGKSILAAAMPSILPPMTAQEALEVSMIHSVAGQLDENGIVLNRPFRDPHHSASMPALVGGGSKARPGEISLAHHGVLFLDELPEFKRDALESLRQPIETGKIAIARANRHVTYPAKFQLIAAMNPCRCGFLGDKERECRRAPHCGAEYRARLSGPLLDRFDLVMPMPALTHAELARPAKTTPTEHVQERITNARKIQIERSQQRRDKFITNADLSGDILEKSVIPAMSTEAKNLFDKASENLNLSARGWHRLQRLCRTIADLEGEDTISTHHVGEAASYRIESQAALGLNQTDKKSPRARPPQGIL